MLTSQLGGHGFDLISKQILKTDLDYMAASQHNIGYNTQGVLAGL